MGVEGDRLHMLVGLGCDGASAMLDVPEGGVRRKLTELAVRKVGSL